MIKKIRLLVVVQLWLLSGITAQPTGNEYKILQQSLATGWNTWNTKSVLSHVKLPEGIAVNIGFKTNHITSKRYLQEAYISHKEEGQAKVVPGYHSYNGSYTSCKVIWEGMEVNVESAHEGDNNLVLLLTPEKLPAITPYFVIEAGMLWNKNGSLQSLQNSITIKVKNKQWNVYSSSTLLKDALPVTTPYLVCSAKEITGISVGTKKTLAQIRQIISKQKNIFENGLKKYEGLSETYLAQQSVLAWNMIYDAGRNAVFAPVSRVWNSFFGGHYVLFDWDTYLSGLMAGFDNKQLAYANVMEVTKGIDVYGMVPNYTAANGLGSPDRSQPPVGSMVVYELYDKYKDKWLVEQTYNRLLKWNRWWPKHRDAKGYLCWGSDDILPDGAANTWQGAAYESGLDNSPMYDAVPFNKQTHLMELADVGLMSLYIADCNYLALLAEILNRKEDATELKTRANKYSVSLQTLWNEESGLFLNKRTDNNEWSPRLSPTLFYPLLAKVATARQAERMVNEHLLNEAEFWGEYVLPSSPKNDTAFKQQDYWRGRIWAPLNFLVYKGLKQYPFSTTSALLAEKSNALLLKNWQTTKGVYENYHASGVGRLSTEPVNKSDNFYHWGALMGYMWLLEKTDN